MHPMTFPVLLSFALAAIFAGSGLLQIAGPKFVRDAYQRWHFPRNFHRVSAGLQLLAAVFLALDVTRIWGIFLAGAVTFVAVITLLNHRQYAYAIPGMLLLVSLAPASLAAV
jgi:hypothetical protein